MKHLFLTVSLLLSSLAGRAAPTVALAAGEVLHYRVRWGWFTNAGTIDVSSRLDQSAGLPQIRISTHTSTRGFVRSLYLFDGDGESIFDARDGRLLAISTWSTSSNKVTRTMAVFDYPASTVRYVDYVDPQHNQNVPLPSGNPMDLITSLIETRRWDLHPGDRVPTTVVFGKDFYDLVIVAEKYEHVRTPMGEFDTLLLVPTMEVNPRGLFKRGGHVRVWISQDERHLPVQFEVGMKYGTGIASLSEYRAPARIETQRSENSQALLQK